MMYNFVLQYVTQRKIVFNFKIADNQDDKQRGRSTKENNAIKPQEELRTQRKYKPKEFILRK